MSKEAVEEGDPFPDSSDHLGLLVVHTEPGDETVPFFGGLGLRGEIRFS